MAILGSLAAQTLTMILTYQVYKFIADDFTFVYDVPWFDLILMPFCQFVEPHPLKFYRKGKAGLFQ
jgi:hypothetical protein